MALCVPASVSTPNKTRQCVTLRKEKFLHNCDTGFSLKKKKSLSVTNCRVHGVQRPNALQGELTAPGSADYLRAIPQ